MNWEQDYKFLRETYDNKQIGKQINSKKYTHVKEGLFAATSILNEFEGISVAERIFLYENPSEQPICENNKKKNFVNSKLRPPTGYKFCGAKGSDCICHNEFKAEQPVKTDEEKAETRRKQVETWQKTLGVDNPAKSKKVIEKSLDSRKKSETDESRLLKARAKQLEGYKQVIDRLKDVVTPLFTEDEYKGCFRKNFYKWKCNVCSNEFDGHVDGGNIPKCNKCYNKGSAGETELRQFIHDLGFDTIDNKKDALVTHEIDIYIPSLKIGFEYNGDYWHSSEHRADNYHVEKYLLAKSKGIRLIQIFENEWVSKKEIVKSRVMAILSKSERIYARNTIVKELLHKDSKEFLDKHHLQGNCPATFKYGLYHNEDLVAVMTFGKSRYSEDGMELLRYASSGSIVGGAGKLLNKFLIDHSPSEVITYADRCWSDGNLYTTLGFEDITENEKNCGYFYVKGFVKYHRSNFTKGKLVSMGHDKNLTEFEIMKNEGYLRVHNCGNYKFVLRNNEICSKIAKYKQQNP